MALIRSTTVWSNLTVRAVSGHSAMNSARRPSDEGTYESCGTHLDVPPRSSPIANLGSRFVVHEVSTPSRATGTIFRRIPEGHAVQRYYGNVLFTSRVGQVDPAFMIRRSKTNRRRRRAHQMNLSSLFAKTLRLTAVADRLGDVQHVRLFATSKNVVAMRSRFEC